MGLSSEPPEADYSLDRHVDDVVAFSESQKVARVMDAVAGDRPAAAAHVMIEDVATEYEMARLADEGFFQAVARNVPIAVQVMQQASASDGPSPTDAAGLARIRAPILYSYGSETRSTWYTDASVYVSDHAETVRVLEITGGGHFALRFAPERIARALIAN